MNKQIDVRSSITGIRENDLIMWYWCFAIKKIDCKHDF